MVTTTTIPSSNFGTPEVIKSKEFSRTESSTTWRNICISILASGISNTTGQILGHPLDTIKLRMQLENQKLTMRQCAKDMIRKEGSIGFMKGVSQPVAGALPVAMMAFAVNDYSTDILRTNFPNMSLQRQSFLAGAIGGLCSLSIFVPLELLKCRAQMKKDGRLSIRKEAAKILRERGIRGLYQGLIISALRIVPGYGTYFSTFRVLQQYGDNFVNNNNLNVNKERKQQLLQIWTINSGGIAGVAAWTVSIPQDIIKTKQQCHTGPQPLKMHEAFRQLMQEGGPKRIFKGMPPTLLRAYLVNMVVLPMFDFVSNYLKNVNV